MKQELEAAYRYRRDHMFKQMQLGFRQQQSELVKRAAASQEKKKKKRSKRDSKKKGKGKEKGLYHELRRWGDKYSDSGSSSDDDTSESGESSDDDSENEITVSPWDRHSDYEAPKKARAKVDVVVCTTDHGESDLFFTIQVA